MLRIVPDVRVPTLSPPFPRQKAAPSLEARARPYLVFMRTGADGLYSRWLEQEPDRNWDLFLSRYTPGAEDPAAIATASGGYNKLEHFRDCVRTGLIDLGAYRRILLADDDLDVTVGSISAFFDTVERLDLTVAHPAQAWDGYWSLRIMLRNPLAQWRETNFVEVMCPCFATSFLAQALEAFVVTRSTWGSDHAFCHLARAAGGHVGVVDTVAIRHVRPIRTSGAFYRKLAADGVDPDEELARVLEALPPQERVPRVLRIHPMAGWPGWARGRLAGLVEWKKRDIIKLFGHRQDRDD